MKEGVLLCIRCGSKSHDCTEVQNVDTQQAGLPLPLSGGHVKVETRERRLLRASPSEQIMGLWLRHHGAEETTT